MLNMTWCNRQTLQKAAWDDVSGRVSAPVRKSIEKVLASLDGGVLSREECLALANCDGR